jgi:hypothetical protein
MNKPKLNGGFFAAWIITFVVLYALSYTWHGIFLNDLSRVSYPINFFLFFTAVVYFIIAFILTFLTHFLHSLGKNKVKRGILIGMPMGLFIYLIAFVFGISFYSNPTLAHIAFDACWQVIEQGIGGLVVGAVLSLSEVTSSKRAF